MNKKSERETVIQKLLDSFRTVDQTKDLLVIFNMVKNYHSKLNVDPVGRYSPTIKEVNKRLNWHIMQSGRHRAAFNHFKHVYANVLYDEIQRSVGHQRNERD